MVTIIIISLILELVCKNNAVVSLTLLTGCINMSSIPCNETFIRQFKIKKNIIKINNLLSFCCFILFISFLSCSFFLQTYVKKNVMVPENPSCNERKTS
jgi:hypothetical protein